MAKTIGKDNVRPRKELGNIQRLPNGQDDYLEATAAQRLPKNEVDAEQIAGDREERRRFVKGDRVGKISRKPHVDVILSSIYVIAWEELSRLMENSRSRPLSEEELRRFAKLAGDVLPKVIREEREQQKQEKLDQLTNEEMLSKLEEARRVLAQLEGADAVLGMPEEDG